MLELKVWSDYACFTRPENKVERVTYDVMTPSAARGVLEAVFWKPEFEWQVREIAVLKPIRRFSLLRNEVNTLASERTARAWAANGGGFLAEEDRAQRHALVLRDVCYVIRADIVPRAHATDPLQKYTEMFTRRAEKGQAFHQPYLGNREFTAFFGPPDPSETPIDLSEDLGRMLFDLHFQENGKGRLKYRAHGEGGARWATGNATPRFFNARLDKGVLHVPRHLYGEVDA
ncbi:type I-C CRISPR-associated protein Cas5c [Deinococcus aestuarii]|uniref:type I-C CRISPR-associated protein Cas5c n=1 Tax=Deinococcus aestuarii TaxID=2774531 RepID=UPI001C0E4987